MKALVVCTAAAAGVALAGCPLAPQCEADPSTTLVVDGEACEGCTVDFGDVEVPLQEHRRIDIRQGCQDGFVDSPSITGDGFTLSNFVFPQGPGGLGFAEVSFTATDLGRASGTLDLPSDAGDLQVDLLGNGVSP